LPTNESLTQRVSALERSAALHDKQIKTIRSLVQEGMRLMIETRKDMRVMVKGINDLTNTLKRGTNGRAKGKVDIQ